MDKELKKIQETYVKPYYMLLHGGVLIQIPAEAFSNFRRDFLQAASEISDEQIMILLNAREWRGRLTAAWIIGIKKKQKFVSDIGELLIASEVVYAGSAYCLALALIGEEDCEKFLFSYLDTYLPLRRNRIYDQCAAIGALSFILGKPREKYLKPSLWTVGKYSLDPNECIDWINSFIGFLRSKGMA